MDIIKTEENLNRVAKTEALAAFTREFRSMARQLNRAKINEATQQFNLETARINRTYWLTLFFFKDPSSEYKPSNSANSSFSTIKTV